MTYCSMGIDEIPSDFTNETPYVFNVFFHKIVANDGSTPDILDSYGYHAPDGIGDGDLIDENEYLEAIQALNIKFNRFNIFFNYFGNDVIPNSDFLTLTFSSNLDDSNYDEFLEFTKNNTDENGEIYYKYNALNLFITHIIPGAFGMQVGHVSTESFYNYRTFQPTAQQQIPGNPSHVVPDSYDFISAIVPHEIGHCFSLQHTYAYSRHREVVSGVQGEHVTRDVSSPDYNADTKGDGIADTNANSNSLGHSRYFDFNTCTCNQAAIIAGDDDINQWTRDWTDYVVVDGLEYPAGELFQIGDQMFNQMGKFVWQYYAPSTCNDARVFTNGQGAKMRCAIEGLSDVFQASETDLASLYKPYKEETEYHFQPYSVSDNGDGTAEVCKLRGLTFTHYFQPGFDYEFFRIGTTNFDNNASSHEISAIIDNGIYRSVKINQINPIFLASGGFDTSIIDNSDLSNGIIAYNLIVCNRPAVVCETKPFDGGKVISTTNLANPNISIKVLDNQEASDPNLEQNLENNKYHIIEKTTTSGEKIQKTIYKNGN